MNILSFFSLLFYFFYLFLKIFRTMCYSKIMFDWLPIINQHLWPFSFFRIITKPFFYFWVKILPPIRFKKFNIDISQIFGIEFLNFILYFIIQIYNTLFFIFF